MGARLHGTASDRRLRLVLAGVAGGAGGAGGAVYVATTWLLRVPEARALMAGVTGRLTRR